MLCVLKFWGCVKAIEGFWFKIWVLGEEFSSWAKITVSFKSGLGEIDWVCEDWAWKSCVCALKLIGIVIVVFVLFG